MFVISVINICCIFDSIAELITMAEASMEPTTFSSHSKMLISMGFDQTILYPERLGI